MTAGISRSYDRNMNFTKATLLNLILCSSLLFSVNCTGIPANTGTTPTETETTGLSHVRKLTTPAYAGSGGVIFLLDGINSNIPGTILTGVIKTFGQNDAPLSIAMSPDQFGAGQVYVDQLLSYCDAGIIDISVDGRSLHWLPQQANNSNPAYGGLESSLSKSREQCNFYFGEAPAACAIPLSAFGEANYSALRQAGFKVLCATDSSDSLASAKPTDWSGKIDPSGLYRLPIIEAGEITPGLTDSARQSIESLGTAVIRLQLSTFQGQDGKADTARLLQLTALIKSCQELGQITTLESWYKYTAVVLASVGKERPLPPYPGGPVVIFGLDGVAKGSHEEAVKKIIEVFQKNGVPVDCGIVSSADGIDSFDIPWLKQLFDQGYVGVSINGYDWTYYQFDTSREHESLLALRDKPCIDWSAVQRDIVVENVTYSSIKSKLLQARAQYLKYFGVMPMVLSLPTDFFDATSYAAIRDAGFKVLVTRILTEPHAATDYTVDFPGKRDPGGMYRIPTAANTCAWGGNCTWAGVIDIGKKAAIQDYCKYHDTYQNMYGYNDHTWSVCTGLERLGVVAVSIDTNCFIDNAGKPDTARLEKLDALVKWYKSFATILTFDQWYRYKSVNK